MMEWYSQLIKPVWAPPAYLFGPVWTVLYILIAVSFIATTILFIKKKIPFLPFLAFILNIIFNLAFTPLQFALKSNILAAIDIVLVLATLIYLIVTIYPYKKWIAVINVPYLIWVSFATILQFTITYLNFKI